MKFITKFVCISILFLLPNFCFAENEEEQIKQEDVAIRTIDRENYQVQIKQYSKNYPIVLYVVFKESTPLLEEIRQILKTELLTLVKTEIEPEIQKNKNVKKEIKEDTEYTTGLETITKVVIASAWFDNQISENLEKIELTKKYGAFVWFYDEENKTKKTLTFDEYLKYLKKKKEENKNKTLLENSKEIAK